MVQTFISRTFFLFIISVSVAACSNQAVDQTHSQTVVADSSLSANLTKSDSIANQKSMLTKIYTLAIYDYLHSIYKSDKIAFDTLYFGKHVYGQEDDFPDITLPDKIESTYIRVVSPELGLQMQKARKTLVYVNMMGWVEKDKANFIFVTFSNGGQHKFDCTINYKCNSTIKEYDLENSRLEYFNKEGKVVRMISNVGGKFPRNN